MDGDGRLPADPLLREVAETLEEAGLSGEILDSKWRGVFISSEYARTVGVDPAAVADFYGISGIRRGREHRTIWSPDRETGERWWQRVAPYMRWDVAEDGALFEEIFDHVTERARQVQPVEPPASFTVQVRFELPGIKQAVTGPGRFTYVRLAGADGLLRGMLVLAVSDVPATLSARLARGDLAMLARMDRLREPERRSAGILFADLVGSGDLSRRLSSRAYFELIRSLTDLIDETVGARDGIIGKHAGDGASALFLTAEAGESAAARATIDAAREIRTGAAGLLPAGPPIAVKVGVHWGAMLTVGQISTHGRLEVTALGDEMNEAARIESATEANKVLASKNLIERLTQEDSAALGLSLDEVAYQPLSELTAEGKILRDAGSIAVTEL